MKNFFEIIQNQTGISVDLQIKILSTVVSISAWYFLRTLALKILWEKTEDVRVRYIGRKIISSVLMVFFIIILLIIWFKGFASTATFFGLLSAGLAISLKDIIVDIVGWIFILVREPFTLGDRIQIGDYSGDVIDIRMFQFTLMEIGNWVDADQSTGRIIHVPNRMVFSAPLANYSKGFQYIWNEIPVLITFESNWKKAKNILQNIVNKYAEHLTQSAQERIKESAKKFMIMYSTLTPTVYTSVKDSGILLTVRYLCEPRARRSSTHFIWEEILDQFARCEDIDFAYPTQRFYNNILEGKSGLKINSRENINPSENNRQ